MNKSQETGWLENMLGWGRRKQTKASELLYVNAVEMARNPAFYATHGVADTVDGRFDALALVVALTMRRLKMLSEKGSESADSGIGASELSQNLFDSMFADMDLSLREMGAGDIGVSKRVRIMAEAFMGRLDAYATALDANDRTALGAALERNLLRGQSAPDEALIDFVLALNEKIAAIDDADLLAGKLV